jgi:hypothetical protein
VRIRRNRPKSVKLADTLRTPWRSSTPDSATGIEDGRLHERDEAAASKPCVFCNTGRSGRKGEHVLPRWLLKMWSAESGPFTLFRDGEPVRKRDGQVRTETSATRFSLPVCSECNGVLEERFEAPAKPLMRQLLTTDDPVLGQSEAKVVGQWFVVAARASPRNALA